MIDFKERLRSYEQNAKKARKLRKKRERTEEEAMELYTLERGHCPCEITALLNLYHEVRGSEHRHNHEKFGDWWYSRVYGKLHDEYHSSD